MLANERTVTRPYIMDKSMGAAVDLDAVDLPTTNADGLPVIDLTQEQKYLFDLRGWLLIPGVLSEEEAAEMRLCAAAAQRSGITPRAHVRSSVALQRLADHPQVVGFMNRICGVSGLSSQECYGFRQESCHLFYRSQGQGKFGPHNGSGMLRFPGDSHTYHCIPGKANAGLTRVVWELNPVRKGEGGTLLVSGTHKGVYQAPTSINDPNSPIWETYECPPGSLLFFTEALTHSATPWTNSHNDRVAIFSCYNTVNSQVAQLESAGRIDRDHADQTANALSRGARPG
ncbi:MAG: hypothetical protein R2867_11600 [Caldilineaceae bacterium]